MPVEQVAIPRVEQMPSIPQPFKMKDWRALAVAYDQFAFDFEARGEFLPLIWWNDGRRNVGRRTFGLPSYVGAPNATGSNHEGITCMGAVLGATVAGIDKSAGEYNWVLMCEEYFNKANGQNLVLNRTSAGTGGSFWYELWPHVLFYALADRHPQLGSMQAIVKATADRWAEAVTAMKGDFEHTAFDFKTMKPVDNGKWTEPDAAGGIAWLMLAAWQRWRAPKYLEAADACLRFLNDRATHEGALYEVLMPFGALAAARMTAEHGRRYDIDKFINWCFNGTNPCRWGWGIVAERWGDADCHGLQGSIPHKGGGYAFAMTTFAFPAAFVPLARYDDRYARAMGKYVLNAANAARLLYPDEHPPARQSSAFWKGDPKHLIAYEALLHESQGKRPYATGDALEKQWGPKTDLGLYGGSLVGLFGGLIAPTNHEAILRLDCLATDFFRAPAHPTFLYYNPYPNQREVTLDLDELGKTPATLTHVGGVSVPRVLHPTDLYDALANRFLKRRASGRTTFPIPPDSAVLLVIVPSGGTLTHDGRKTLLNGVVIDYNNGRVPLPPPDRPRPRPDHSVAVDAAHATPIIDGDPSDWAALASATLHLDTGGRGTLKCDLRFAWDAEHLYLLAVETPGDATQREATNPLHYERSPWDFDGVMLFLDLDNAAERSPHSDFNACFGFSSAGRRDLFSARTNRPGEFYRPSKRPLARCRVATSGSFAKHTRAIEAAIPWRDIAGHCYYGLPSGESLPQAIRPGFRFGCEPLLLDDGWQKQAFIGGAQHDRPSGRDANSRDIVLRGEAIARPSSSPCSRARFDRLTSP